MRTRCLLASLFSVLAASYAVACDCAPPPPAKESLEKAAAVFVGKVTKVEDAGGFQNRVTLEVTASHKGVKEKEITIFTAQNGAACGYGFEKGTSYLVYAYETKDGEKKTLGTNICTRTVRWPTRRRI